MKTIYRVDFGSLVFVGFGVLLFLGLSVFVFWPSSESPLSLKLGAVVLVTSSAVLFALLLKYEVFVTDDALHASVRKTFENLQSVTGRLDEGEGTAGKLYGAQTTPHIFIINPDGKLIYQGAIDDIPSVDKADIATAVNYVDAVLTAALAGNPVTTPSSKSYGCSVKY